MSDYHDNKIARMIERSKGTPLKDLYQKYIHDDNQFGHIASECTDGMITDKDKIKMLGTCVNNYLKGDMKPADGFQDDFYSGVLWVYSKMVALFDESDDKEGTK